MQQNYIQHQELMRTPYQEQNSQQNIALSPSSLQPHCLFHAHEFITNMCINPNCLLPLCPRCIPKHFNQHAQLRLMPNIESLQDVRDSVRKNLKNQQEKVSQMIFDNSNEDYDSPYNQIAQAKSKILDMINSFFTQLELDLKNISKLYENSKDQLDQKNVLLHAYQQELGEKIKKLDGPKFLKTLIKSLQPDQQETIKFFENDQKKLKKNLAFGDLVQIDIDDSKLYNLKMELARFIRLSYKENIQQQYQSHVLSTPNAMVSGTFNSSSASRYVLPNGFQTIHQVNLQQLNNNPYVYLNRQLN